MTELERVPGAEVVEDQKDILAIPGVLSATSLKLPEGMELDEWLRVMHTLKLIGKAVQWWVGDALAYGEDHYGEKAFQALERADKTFANWASVCRGIDRSRRRESLKFSHHAEVSSLNPKEQAEVLDKAEENEWTVRETREEADRIKQKRAERGHGPAEVARTETCPRCHGAGEVVVER